MIEALESRTLFSTNVVSHLLEAGALPSAQRAVTHTIHGALMTHVGSTLHLLAGVAFTGKIAFYASPVLDPPEGLSASINWGDGSTSTATLQYGTQAAAGGYQIGGSHTYSKAGNFRIKTIVSIGPIALPGQPAPEFPTRIVETIIGKAVVAAAHVNSTGGTTISEIAGQGFAAGLGSFTTIAPATHLRAVVSWGDGSHSRGTLTSTSVIGTNVMQFAVSGTHAYADTGAYFVHVVVTRPGNGLSTSTPHLVARIYSTAAVTVDASSISLVGAISGTYTTPITNPDVGKQYNFTGTGNLGTVGNVSATGTISLPGFIVSGRATGTMSLTNSQGSVTLDLTGPIEAGFGAFPSTLSFSIAQATGTYAGDTDSGTIAVSLIPGAGAADSNQFTFVIA